MYQLWVYYPGETTVRARVSVERAADVIDLIPKLLAEHDGCEHVVAMFNDTRLFSVDCAGNRKP